MNWFVLGLWIVVAVIALAAVLDWAAHQLTCEDLTESDE